MDITFWVIQGVLLTPVLFLAASVGSEPPHGRSRRGGSGLAPVPPTPKPEPPSPFSAEQRARLLILRAFVREAKMGRGALQDDIDPTIEPQPNKRRQLSRRHLWLAAGALLILIGAVGMVRTNMAIDDIQRNATVRFDPLSPAARFLPGVLVNPAKYLSAVNGGSATPTLEAAGVMQAKEAMDRWEALALIGLGVVLFLGVQPANDDSAVASDVAPFVLVAAFLFAALSFFELP